MLNPNIENFIDYSAMHHDLKHISDKLCVFSAVEQESVIQYKEFYLPLINKQSERGAKFITDVFLPRNNKTSILKMLSLKSLFSQLFESFCLSYQLYMNVLGENATYIR